MCKYALFVMNEKQCKKLPMNADTTENSALDEA